MQLCVCVLYVGSWNGGSVPVYVCVCVCLNVCIYDLVCTKTLKQNRRKNYLSLRMPRVCVCVLVCIDLCERMRACNKLTARVCAHTIHFKLHIHTQTYSNMQFGQYVCAHICNMIIPIISAATFHVCSCRKCVRSSTCF